MKSFDPMEFHGEMEEYLFAYHQIHELSILS